MTADMINSRDRQLTQSRGKNLYKAESGAYSAECLQNLIHSSIAELAETVEKSPVSLENTDDVIKRAFVYLRVCEENAVFPSTLGLSRALGYTNRSLNAWRQKKADTDTGKFLQQFAEMCADILHTSSLKNNANSIVSIFLSKAMYDINDSTNVVINAGNGYNDPFEKKPDIEEIRARYMQHDEVADYPFVE